MQYVLELEGTAQTSSRIEAIQHCMEVRRNGETEEQTTARRDTNRKSRPAVRRATDNAAPQQTGEAHQEATTTLEGLRRFLRIYGDSNWILGARFDGREV